MDWLHNFLHELQNLWSIPPSNAAAVNIQAAWEPEVSEKPLIVFSSCTGA